MSISHTQSYAISTSAFVSLTKAHIWDMMSSHCACCSEGMREKIGVAMSFALFSIVVLWHRFGRFSRGVVPLSQLVFYPLISLHLHVKITACPITTGETFFAGVIIEQIESDVLSRCFPRCCFVHITKLFLYKCMNRIGTVSTHNNFVILSTTFDEKLIVLSATFLVKVLGQCFTKHFGILENLCEIVHALLLSSSEISEGLFHDEKENKRGEVSRQETQLHRPSMSTSETHCRVKELRFSVIIGHFVTITLHTRCNLTVKITLENVTLRLRLSHEGNSLQNVAGADLTVCKFDGIEVNNHVCAL